MPPPHVMPAPTHVGAYLNSYLWKQTPTPQGLLPTGMGVPTTALAVVSMTVTLLLVLLAT